MFQLALSLACEFLNIRDKSAMRRVIRDVHVLLGRGCVLVSTKDDGFAQSVSFYEIVATTKHEYVCRQRNYHTETVDEDEYNSRWGVQSTTLDDGFQTVGLVRWQHGHIHNLLKKNTAKSFKRKRSAMQIHKQKQAYETEWVH